MYLPNNRLFLVVFALFFGLAVTAMEEREGQHAISEHRGTEKKGKNDELFAAVESGNLERVKEAIKAGANVNARNLERDGITCLHVAAQHNFQAIITELIRAGANPNVQKRGSYTPLHTAGNNIEAINALIDGGAETTIADILGLTPFAHACQAKNQKTIKALKKSPKNMSPLLKLKSKFVMNTGSGSKKATDNDKALLAAVEKGDIHSVLQLIEIGANVNCSKEDKTTPLHIAASSNYHQIAKMLICCGARAYAEDSGGNMPITLAGWYGSTEVVQEFANASLTFNHRRLPYHPTPLHYAAQRGHLNTVKKYVELGADVNARAGEQMNPIFTPLDYCRNCGNSELIKYLEGITIPTITLYVRHTY